MNTAFHLHGKKILITGATGGIGEQIAISLADMGAQLVLTGRNKEKLEGLLSKFQKGEHQIIASDLLDIKSREHLIQDLPMLDGIVHGAGIVFPYPIKFLNQQKINETLNINYEAPVLLMADITAKRKLNEHASVVFISSISGQHPHKGGALYAGAKAALEAFSKVMALEFYQKGIRSNCISPAMVKTAMYEVAEKKMSAEAMNEHISQYPLGVGYPTDVANAVTFLLSSASRWITGQNITLDGGFLLGK